MVYYRIVIFFAMSMFLSLFVILLILSMPKRLVVAWTKDLHHLIFDFLYWFWFDFQSYFFHETFDYSILQTHLSLQSNLDACTMFSSTLVLACTQCQGGIRCTTFHYSLAWSGASRICSHVLWLTLCPSFELSQHVLIGLGAMALFPFCKSYLCVVR